MAIDKYEKPPVTPLESLQIPGIPYMYAPDIEGEKLADQDGRESRLNERWNHFVIPGPISSFAYAERVKIIQDLRVALAALDSEIQAVKLAEKQNWRTWDENQKALVELNTRVSQNHFVCLKTSLKTRWARFRYRFSSRRSEAYDVHWHSVQIKCSPLRVRKRNLMEGGRQQLQELDEKEAALIKKRKNRPWLERHWDPDFMRRTELIEGMRALELRRLKVVMRESRCRNEAEKVS